MNVRLIGFMQKYRGFDYRVSYHLVDSNPFNVDSIVEWDWFTSFKNVDEFLVDSFTIDVLNGVPCLNVWVKVPEWDPDEMDVEVSFE